MASIDSLKNIITIVQDIANRSESIKGSFGYGKTYDYGMSNKDMRYPTLWLTAIDATLNKSDVNARYVTIDYTFNLKCLDRIRKDMLNKVDVESDTLTLLTQIITELNDHPYYTRSDLKLVGNINFTPIQGWSNDQVSGHECQITFRMINRNTFCGLPFTPIAGVTFPGPEWTGFTYSPPFLTCSTVTACTSLQTYVTDAIAESLTGLSSANYYTTGATLAGTLAIFDRNDLLSAYTLQLSGLTSTGGTSGDLWSSSTGSNSIIANNGSGNIAGGNYAIATGKLNSASGNYSFAGGSGNTITGLASTIVAGTNNTVTGNYSSVLGGGGFYTYYSYNYNLGNTINGNRSSVINGRNNIITSDYSTILNGSYSLITGNKSIIGGFQNSAITQGVSVILNGSSNLASGSFSFVGNGSQNKVTNNNAAILIGGVNTASGYASTILNGFFNTASGYLSFIGSGRQNLASEFGSSIINGLSNSATSIFSSIVGGLNNVTSGISSSIIGGSGHTIIGDNSAIIGGKDITALDDDTVYMPNLFVITSSTSNKFYVSGYDAVNPGYSNAIDTNTGLMFDGPDILSLHTGGPQRLLINALGQISNGSQLAGTGWEVYFSGDTRLDTMSATTITATTLVTDTFVAQANSVQTLDWSIASNFDFTITANTQFTFSNSKNGSQILVSVANNTSTSNLLVTWSAATATIYWMDQTAPTQSSNTGRTDVYSFMRINNKIFGTAVQNFY